jgi:hypothetical protein
LADEPRVELEQFVLELRYPEFEFVEQPDATSARPKRAVDRLTRAGP